MRPAGAALALIAALALVPVTGGPVRAAEAAALDYKAALDRLEDVRAAVESGERDAARGALESLRADAEGAGDTLKPTQRGDILGAVHSELAGLAWQTGDGAKAAEHLRASLDAFGVARRKDQPVSYILHELALATTLANAGAIEAADAALERADAHFEVLFSDTINTGLAFSLVFKRDMTRGYIAMADGDAERAVTGAADALDLAERMGTPYRPVFKLLQAFAEARADRLEAAASAADEAAEGGLSFGDDYVSRAMLFRAGALAAQGEREAARKVARAAERYAEKNAVQVALIQLLERLDREGGGWPARFDPRTPGFLLAVAPRFRMSSEIEDYGDGVRVARPAVNVGYAFEIVSAE